MKYTGREMGKDRFLLRIGTFGTVYTSVTNESFYYLMRSMRHDKARVYAVNICEIYIKKTFLLFSNPPLIPPAPAALLPRRLCAEISVFQPEIRRLP